MPERRSARVQSRADVGGAAADAGAAAAQALTMLGADGEAAGNRSLARAAAKPAPASAAAGQSAKAARMSELLAQEHNKRIRSLTSVICDFGGAKVAAKAPRQSKANADAPTAARQAAGSSKKTQLPPQLLADIAAINSTFASELEGRLESLARLSREHKARKASPSGKPKTTLQLHGIALAPGSVMSLPEKNEWIAVPTIHGKPTVIRDTNDNPVRFPSPLTAARAHDLFVLMQNCSAEEKVANLNFPDQMEQRRKEVLDLAMQKVKVMAQVAQMMKQNDAKETAPAQTSAPAGAGTADFASLTHGGGSGLLPNPPAAMQDFAPPQPPPQKPPPQQRPQQRPPPQQQPLPARSPDVRASVQDFLGAVAPNLQPAQQPNPIASFMTSLGNGGGAGNVSGTLDGLANLVSNEELAKNPLAAAVIHVQMERVKQQQNLQLVLSLIKQQAQEQKEAQDRLAALLSSVHNGALKDIDPSVLLSSAGGYDPAAFLKSLGLANATDPNPRHAEGAMAHSSPRNSAESLDCEGAGLGSQPDSSKKKGRAVPPPPPPPPPPQAVQKKKHRANPYPPHYESMMQMRAGVPQVHQQRQVPLPHVATALPRSPTANVDPPPLDTLELVTKRLQKDPEKLLPPHARNPMSVEGGRKSKVEWPPKSSVEEAKKVVKATGGAKSSLVSVLALSLQHDMAIIGPEPGRPPREDVVEAARERLEFVERIVGVGRPLRTFNGMAALLNDWPLPGFELDTLGRAHAKPGSPERASAPLAGAASAPLAGAAFLV